MALIKRLIVISASLLAGNGPDAPAAPPSLARLDPPGLQTGTTTRLNVHGSGLRVAGRIEIAGVGTLEARPNGDGTLGVDVTLGPDAELGFREVRVETPAGLSSALSLRIDRLPQRRGLEPDDDPGAATPLPLDSSAFGTLTPGDLDHYRVNAKAGQSRTIEVEARRLGVPLAPVLTLFDPGLRPVHQERATPGCDGDARVRLTFPVTGSYVVQVRDNTYLGHEDACYRLRVTDEPFATALFPLGGKPGTTVTFEASGGNLSRPLIKELRLGDRPSRVCDVGLFSDAGRVVLPPMTVRVDGAEERSEGSTSSLAPGLIVNGRVARAGEVDRFSLKLANGQAVRLSVAAASCGSWLDSVLTLKRADGRVLAENDDGGVPDADGLTPPDSRLDYVSDADQTVQVELTDRFGQGGPEFAYRLAVEPPRPEIEATLAAGPTDVFNLTPGTVTPVSVRLSVRGRTGPVVVKAVGLPDGVTADQVTVRPKIGFVPSNEPTPAPLTAAISLRVAENARPTRGWMEVSVAAPISGGVITTEATALVMSSSSPLPAPARPAYRRVRRFPVVVIRGD